MKSSPIKILFFQHFGKNNVIRGAHYKTIDFYRHISTFPDYEPFIAFDEGSYWNESIPWYSIYPKMPTLNDIEINPDALFLNSGKDWIKYDALREINDQVPIISPVNNFRALNPNHKSYRFLTRKATRLCPSPELYNDVSAHPLTNGKTYYLPNGVEIFESARQAESHKTTDILIVGNKKPELAEKIFVELRKLNCNFKIKILTSWLPKEQFQNEMAKSCLSIHLPMEVEAHYIPAIEAMMLGSLVITPLCKGNQSYAKHMSTCFVSRYDQQSLCVAVNHVLNMSPFDKAKISTHAKREAEIFSIDSERVMLKKILDSTFQG